MMITTQFSVRLVEVRGKFGVGTLVQTLNTMLLTLQWTKEI